MLLIPTLRTDGSLEIEAHSFQEEEVLTVASYLLEYGVAFSVMELRADRLGRIVRRYTIDRADVGRLEGALQAGFTVRRDRTTVEFIGDGQPFRCIELGNYPLTI